MVDGFSCILIKGIHQFNPQNLKSFFNNNKEPKAKKKKKKKSRKAPPPTHTHPLKQSTRNLSLGYTEIEKKRTALGQYLFCVICNWAVWNFDLCYLISSHLISSQSLNLGGHRGTTNDVATIPFHPSLPPVAVRESPNPVRAHESFFSLVTSFIFGTYKEDLCQLFLWKIKTPNLSKFHELRLSNWYIFRIIIYIIFAVKTPILKEYPYLPFISKSLLWQNNSGMMPFDVTESLT